VAQTIAWTATDVIRWDGGFRASISINSLGVIVGVHQTNNGNKRACYYRVGHLGADNKISWDSGNSGQPYTDCETPQIAINDRNQVVEVHNVPGAFKEHYIRGTVVGGVIQFPKDQPRFNDTGSYPSITLTNDGFVAELDWFNSGIEKRVGKLRAASADLIDWAAPSRINLPTDYPPRTNSALGTDGKYVVQVHEAGKDPLLGEAYLVSSVSAIRDRSNWMGDAMPEIGEKKLSQIVIPATHDSGMYCDGALSSFGQTQDETLYQQLEGGIRYFDLRVDSGTATVSPSNQQRIYHGGNFVTCETVGEAMKDVRKFMEEGHKEAIVLKFSHFNHFGSCKSGDYDKLKSIIVADLMPWMLTANGDPAQMRISDLVGDNGRVIAVIDKDWALPVCQEQSGFYVYRDWNSDDPQNGEFNVFDVYANTLNYNTLVKDQFQKFADYNGIMENRSSGEDKSQIQSDLFLLAWTLTPTTGVSEASLPASRGLAAKMSDLEENRNGFIPNLISVDYYERARVTDVSIEMLERLVH
jgi:hypothetical protein